MIKSMTPHNQIFGGAAPTTPPPFGGTVSLPSTTKFPPVNAPPPNKTTTVPLTLAKVDLTNAITSSDPGAGTLTIPIKVTQTGTDNKGNPTFSTEPSGTASADQPNVGCSLTTLDQCPAPDLSGVTDTLGTYTKWIILAIAALAVIVVIKR